MEPMADWWMIRLSMLVALTLSSVPLNAIRARASQADANRYVEQANDLFSRGKMRQAVQAASLALAADPGNARAYLLRGRAHAAFEEPKYAIEDLEMALRLNPDQVGSGGYTDCARAYLQLHQFQPALKLFNTAIQEFSPEKKNIRNIEMAALYRDRATLYEMLNQDEKAFQDLDQAIKWYPAWPNYRARAEFYRRKHDYAKALSDYTRAVNSFPDKERNNSDYLRVRIGRIDLYEKTGQKELAKQERALTNRASQGINEDLR
jgi:tetratricopeptide (TPR) repeat protein